MTTAFLQQPIDEVVLPVDSQVDSTVFGFNLNVSANALSELAVDRSLIADEQLCIFSAFTRPDFQTDFHFVLLIFETMYNNSRQVMDSPRFLQRISCISVLRSLVMAR